MTNDLHWSEIEKLRKKVHEMAQMVAVHEGDLDNLPERVAALEAANERRDGAAGVFQMILKSPALGWLVGAAITAWAVLTGKAHV